MELIENVDTTKLEYLKNMKPVDVFSLFKKCKTNEEKKKQYQKVISYCSRMLKVNGEMKHIYKYTLTTNWGLGGRLFSGLSIQGQCSSIRGFLFNNTMDWDFQNCHPKILLYICKKHSLPLCDYAYLQHYCDNRDEILDTAEDRNEMKINILKVVNDDKVNRKTTGFLKGLDKECKKLQRIIVPMKEYEDIVKTTPSHKLYNFYGSAINRILCKYENELLQDLRQSNYYPDV